MYYIKVELPHVRDPITFGSVSGYVARKGIRYPGLSTKLHHYSLSDHIVLFASAQKANKWAKRNILDPKAKVIVIECYNYWH